MRHTQRTEIIEASINSLGQYLVKDARSCSLGEEECKQWLGRSLCIFLSPLFSLLTQQLALRSGPVSVCRFDFLLHALSRSRVRS